MIITFLFIFIFLSILYFANPQNNRVKNFLLIIIGLILIMTAGLRNKGVDNDYEVYHDFWATNNIQGTVEYSFYIIKVIIKSKLGLNFQYFLLAYAFLGVCMKLIAIKKLSPFLWGSVLIYFSHYFLLHEFTQIRIGVATGFLLLALFYLAKKKFVIFYLYAILAVFFHQSCFIALFFILLSNNNKRFWIYYFIIPLGYIFYFLNTYLSITIPIPGLQDKIDGYQQATESGFLKESKINPFNYLLIIRIAIFYVLMIYSKKISSHLSSFYLLTKIYAFSIFSFLYLSSIPVFSFRIQELLGVVEIILIPALTIIFVKQFKYMGKIIVCCIALCIFLLDVFYNNYIIT